MQNDVNNCRHFGLLLILTQLMLQLQQQKQLVITGITSS